MNLPCKRAKDFAETGCYDVTLPNDTIVQIYRDVHQFGYPVWYWIDTAGKTHHAGYTKAEALTTVLLRNSK